MPHASQGVTPETERLLAETGRLARSSGAFAEVEVRPGRVECRDPIQPDALFRIDASDEGLCVCWASPNRYLSQSIEAELRWTRENIDDLMDEELSDQGYRRRVGRMTHFRDSDKHFVFRWGIPGEPGSLSAERDAPDLLRCLLACQAAFRTLGDMKEPEED